MTTRFVAAAIAGMLTIAVVGGVLYGVILADFFRSNVTLSVMKTPPSLAWVGLSHVPFGLLLALAVRWRGVLTARGGAVTGGILGFLMAASYDFAQYGTTNLWTIRLTLVEPLITMVMVAAAGAVVGVVLGGGTGRHMDTAKGQAEGLNARISAPGTIRAPLEMLPDRALQQQTK